jgi:hypothetical protein
MKAKFLLLLMICCCTWVSAQQVVATAGRTLSNYSGTVSFTIGEGVAQTFTNGEKALTQGFQQGSITVSLVSEVRDLGYAITVFPNPASDFLKLDIDKENLEGFQYLLFDLTGKLINQQMIQNTITDIPVMHLKSGSYIVRVKSGSMDLKTFKIIKL